MDIKDINPEKTVWQIMFETLSNSGFEVYPPATKVGECKSPYIVLKEDGSSQINNYSSERVYYRILLYVPRNMYSQLTVLESEVRKVLDDELYPLILPTGQSDPDFYDDNYNAHMRAFFYRNNRRNKHL